MTKDDWFKIGAGPAVIVILFSMQAYGDQRWIMRAESKEAAVSEYEENIYLLKKNGVTPEEQEDIDFYNLQIQKLGGDPV